MATLEAVHRRRAVRAARNRLRRGNKLTGSAADKAQCEWEAEAVARLIRRVDPLSRHDLHQCYAYWQARRCGWDVFRPWWRRSGRKNADGTPHLYPPEGCPTWLWWSSLTWRQREEVAQEKRRAVSVKAEASGVSLDNPLFYSQAKHVY